MSEPTLLDARDLRTAGSWSAPQRLKNAALRALIRALLAIADRLPEKLLIALSTAAGKLASLLLRRQRQIARARLERMVSPARAQELCRSAFENAGRNLALCLLARRPRFVVLDHVRLSEASRACFDAALAEGRGVVFVSAHLGPFEWVAAAIAELGYSASIVVRESYDPALDDLVDAHRRARGLDVIHRGHALAGARIVRALRRKRAVGVLPDLATRVESVPARFLGAEAMVPVGPARLAHRTGAALVVGTLEPQRELAHALHIERIELGADELATTQCVMSALERAILRAPAHWLWMSPPAARLTR